MVAFSTDMLDDMTTKFVVHDIVTGVPFFKQPFKGGSGLKDGVSIPSRKASNERGDQLS